MAAWQADDYERAARAYDRAIEGYQTALERDAGPSDDQLQRRLRGAIAERELLRVTPLVEADTARRHARQIEEPEAAAANWEDVLDRYQGLLALDWPGDEGFVAETEIVHTQAAAAAEDAIKDYFEAGKRRLGSADRFAVDGRDERATVLYERARGQFEAAHRLAEEANEERLGGIETALKTVEKRLEGDVPAEALSSDGLAVSDGPRQQPGGRQRDARNERPAADGRQTAGRGTRGHDHRRAGARRTPPVRGVPRPARPGSAQRLIVIAVIVFVTTSRERVVRGLNSRNCDSPAVKSHSNHYDTTGDF